MICGCCGCRMTRKTNRYKDKEYHYYYCPTGKRNGCTSSVMLKESDLIECVQDSLKGHIENVASLDAINALSGEIEVFEKSMDSLDNQLAKYRAMEKDAKTLAQDHVLTAKLIERLIERIEIDHERNIHVTFRFKNEFQGKAVEQCATM